MCCHTATVPDLDVNKAAVAGPGYGVVVADGALPDDAEISRQASARLTIT
jgi:hypothetical protein